MSRCEFYNFHCLSGLDGGNRIGASGDHDVVDVLDLLERIRILTRNDLSNGRQGVHFVAGVDTLRGVADLEVNAALQSTLLLQNGHAYVLGDAGIDSRLVNNDGTGFQVCTQGFRSTYDGRQVGSLVAIHGRWYRYDMESGILKCRGVACEFDIRLMNSLVADFLCRIDTSFILSDLMLVDVEAEDLDVL